MDLHLIGMMVRYIGYFDSYNTEANDANCMEASVGAGIISFKKAVALMALFVILGVTI